MIALALAVVSGVLALVVAYSRRASPPPPVSTRAATLDRFATFIFGLSPEQKMQMLDMLSEEQQAEFVVILREIVAANELGKSPER